jgi:hypothetical protein
MRILISADGVRTETDAPAPGLSYRAKRQVASSGKEAPLDVYTNKTPEKGKK